MAISKRIFNGIGMLPDLPAPASGGKLSDADLTALYDSQRAAIRAMNGLLTFGNGAHSSQSGNVDGQWKEVTFVNANTDYEVPHGLGRVPAGIFVADVNADGAVVRGGSQGSWSATRMFVRCNVAGTTARFVVL